MRLEFRTPDGRTAYAPPEAAFHDTHGNQYVFIRTTEGDVRKAYLNGAE